MVWFISSSVLSILVGLFIVTLEQPGSGLNLSIPTETVDTGTAVSGMSLKAFLSHTIPTSIAGAMANNEILQIVVFSMFFGIGGASLGQNSTPRWSRRWMWSPHYAEGDGLRDVRCAAGHFAAISSVIATGAGHFAELCLVYWRLLCGDPSDLSGIAGGRLHGAEKEIFRLVAMLKDPVLVAFTTSSSEAAYPKTLEQLARFGCSRNIASFVRRSATRLTGRLHGLLLVRLNVYRRAYNIHLSFTEVTVLMLTLMLASKGIAGVPRSSLVVLAATIPSFNIPVAGILLLMGIDHFGYGTVRH